MMSVRDIGSLTKLGETKGPHGTNVGSSLNSFDPAVMLLMVEWG